MIITKSIQNRIKKLSPVNPEIQAPFYQAGSEWVTNKYYMVEIPKAGTGKDDAEGAPIMSIAYSNNYPKQEKMTRFDINLLIDMLTIIKDNGANFVDIGISERAIACNGVTKLSNEVIIKGLLLRIDK